MVDFNELRNKAQTLISQHSDQVKGGIDKVGEVVGNKVGHQKTDPVEQKLHGLVDRLKGGTVAGETATGPVTPDVHPAAQPTAAQPTPPSPGPSEPEPAPTPPNPGPSPTSPTTPAEPTLPEQPGSQLRH